MTEKRYSDGTLAKWYYSRTNVISDGISEYYLGSKESIRDWNYDELLGTNDLLDELNRLSDKNEQLKAQLDYVQNSISEHIKHQKTELGQKALREVIQDYNDWLLGHKEVKE